MAKMKSWHLSIGDSRDDGAVGLCAIVRAPTKLKALSKFKALPDTIIIPPQMDGMPGGLEYVNVYLNTENNKLEDICEE